MIRELRIYWALRPTIEQLQGEMKMKLSTNVFIQIIGTLGQGILHVQSLLPPKSQFWCGVGLALLQLTAGVLGHLSDTDGNKLPPATN